MAKIEVNTIENKIILDVYEAAEKSRRGDIRTYLGMSAIGHPCDRALWYGFRGFTPKSIEGRVIMIFELGDHIEEIVIGWLKKAGYHVSNQQDAFSAWDGYFRGHSDGTILGVTSKPHILEVKSAKDSKFKAFKRHGVEQTQPIYYAQSQMYMHYSGEERTLFVIYNKDTSEIYLERIDYNKSHAEALHQRAGRIIFSHWAPQRPFEPETWDCKWCDYRLHCWNPDEAIQEHKRCGTCFYLQAFGENGNPYLNCSKHHFKFNGGKDWGKTCTEWTWLYPDNDEIPF